MFLVLEIWEPTEGAEPQTVTYPRATENEAMSSYHIILSQAAVSQHFRHGAIIMRPDGKYIDRQSFTHPVTEQTNE